MSQPLPDIIFKLNKDVFENLRNTIVCATIAIAGRVILKVPEIAPFPFFGEVFFANFVLVMAALLGGLNIGLGIINILSYGSCKGFKAFFVLGPLALFQGFLSAGVLVGVFRVQLSALNNL
ncbi:hypothetical protein I5L56_08250 [Pseudomonas oryzihabitans]|uniref:hypothetical protein n=1 Tax=Pseudomonas oryzihabitans TaxID=47885 RepID=UPI0018D78D2B|nr:hypothetical protein [Pseudomonas oryzihabitans]MBH3329611.1 hypothetical protein [Pseudomonas oryzihabitans]